MQTAVQPAVGKKAMWAGWAASDIPVLTLLFAGTMKLLQLPSVIQGSAQYGYRASQVPVIGIIEIGCSVVYLIPRTAVLGAILMSGLLGGAIATNVRIGNPAFIGPLILGVLAWAGLYWRDARLRALIPLRASASRQSQ